MLIWIERHPASTALATAVPALILSLVAIYISLSQLPEDPTKIIQIIKKEAELARNGDVDAVVNLFSDDAVIRDAGYSYNYENYRPVRQWHGKKDIRARYEELKQNVKFLTLDHIGINVTFNQYGKTASATSSTQGTFQRSNEEPKDIMTINGDLWTFVKIENKWKIKDFSFHLPPIR